MSLYHLILLSFSLLYCIRKKFIPPSCSSWHHTHCQLLQSSFTNTLLFIFSDSIIIMKTFISLGLAASLATLTFTHTKTKHNPVGDSKIKRGFLTCQETYGGGSITCGETSTSHYCYDPTLGEVSPLGSSFRCNHLTTYLELLSPRRWLLQSRRLLCPCSRILLSQREFPPLIPNII
jgi:hypothetical protein